jgi:hypothetical protein
MWDNNIYYNPEKYGLELTAVIELSEPDYSFDMLAIWKGESGYYLGTDSGCSCPSPFEDFNGVEDLTGPLSVKQVIEEATSLWKGGNRGMGSYDPEGFSSGISLVV